MSETAVSPWAASELSGVLSTQPEFSAYSWSELVTLAHSFQERATEAHFELCDALLEVISRAGDLPADRARSLHEFCAEAYLDERYAREHVRIGRAYPPEERKKYPQLRWGHFQALATRSAVADDTPERRAERVKKLTERAADEELSVPQTERLVREVKQEEAGGASAPADPLAAFLPTLLDGLLRRLRGAETGTLPLIVEEVEAHCRDRWPAVRERFVIFPREES